MSVSPDIQHYVDDVRQRFLAATGLSDVAIDVEPAGPETFLRLQVGADAPLYKSVLARLDRELPEANPFHGALTLKVQRPTNWLESQEVELLRSLITRSLRITTDAALQSPIVDFAPFRGGEEQQIIQPANHAILGRRGVGKSSLILTAYRRISATGGLPVWLDIEPYRARTDVAAIIEIFREFFRELAAIVERQHSNSQTKAIIAAMQTLDSVSTSASFSDLQRLVPSIRSNLREVTQETGRHIFLFLDDAHFIATDLQPHLLHYVHNLFKGNRCWLKVAGVRNLLRLYEPTTKIGLQIPNDVQTISLDLTLVNPGAARDHLTNVLSKFLELCGFSKSSALMQRGAIDRLVWCSAGVPRDFLWLFERSIAFAIQHRRKKVGVKEVNLSVGEFGQQKREELEEDTSIEGASLRHVLDSLQTTVLNELRSNSFLVRQDTAHLGYKMLQKLIDLRLVHLIHPSITPSTAGERFEAYLLDYSFYTGLRRRHNLRERKINVDEPPRYDVLRKLPKVDLSGLVPHEEPNLEEGE